MGSRFYTNTEDHSSTDDRKEKWSGLGGGAGAMGRKSREKEKLVGVGKLIMYSVSA